MPSVKSYQNRKYEIELLKREIEALQITIRLYREYVLKAYPLPSLVASPPSMEIPSCLKPLDAIRYAGERQKKGVIWYGPDNKS